MPTNVPLGDKDGGAFCEEKLMEYIQTATFVRCEGGPSMLAFGMGMRERTRMPQ